MPRGVYDRSKKKGEAAPAKKAPVAKAAPVKAAPVVKAVKAKTLSEAHEYVQGSAPASLDYGRAAAASFGFQILGANLSTLADAHKALNGDTQLYALLAGEIKDTVLTLAALRKDVFRDLLLTQGSASVAGVPEISASDIEGSEVVEEAPPAPIPAPVIHAPVAAALPVPPPAPTLPQGNSGYTPPAPPTLPHH